MSHLHPLYSLVLAVSLGLCVIWVAAETLLRMHGRGTRGRYIWSSVERPTRYPALLYLLLSIVTALREGTLFWILVSLASLGLWLFVRWERRDDDDDDYWKGFGKRLVQSMGRQAPSAA